MAPNSKARNSGDFDVLIQSCNLGEYRALPFLNLLPVKSV